MEASKIEPRCSFIYDCLGVGCWTLGVFPRRIVRCIFHQLPPVAQIRSASKIAEPNKVKSTKSFANVLLGALVKQHTTSHLLIVNSRKHSTRVKENVFSYFEFFQNKKTCGPRFFNWTKKLTGEAI